MEEDTAGRGTVADIDHGLTQPLTSSQLEMLTLPTRHSPDLARANDHLEHLLDRPEYTGDERGSYSRSSSGSNVT
ncbi:hypothetical protein KPL76_01600 [Subtercola sp. PAMC28395]|uniref:hypothetical protein n=1 Tax=Subtercola sp. PAMC28395 TaxID=2846775 RepID=UPI001C0B6CE0|nr:hypothetical protein [Subtercola sp. PAMC28395]QWT24156.1 hypothetical protein KPL76_01600 [Subtercola sp. PAMC28395]